MPARGYFEWVVWNNNRIVNERVAKTDFGGCWVSTVFWGVAEHGPDKHFETMVFKGDPNDEATYEKEVAVWRCATWDEAERQHQMACDWLREQIEALNDWNMIP